MIYEEQAQIEGARAPKVIQQNLMFLPRNNQASSIMQIREFYNAVGPAIRNCGHIGARNDFANPD